MLIFFSWCCFILFTSLIKINSIKYLNSCLLMLYLVFLCNLINPIQITVKITIFFSILPNIFFWYVFIIYNNFLSINPFKHELLILVLFCYSYILFYVLLSIL